MSETKLTPPTKEVAPTHSSTPPGGTNTSATPTPTATPPAPTPTSPPSADEFRFGDSPDVEPWARGKTAREVLSIARGYHDVFQRSGAPTPQAPQAPAQPTGFQAIADDAILTGRDLRAALTQAQREYLAPQMQQSTDMAASGVYGIASMKYDKEFKRYGPEINQELAKIPKGYWTLDNTDTVVNLVAGRHREDYARERAQELVAQMEPTIRPTGGGSGPVPTSEQKAQSLDSEPIPSEWKARAKQAGITESTIREFCTANDMTPEAFFKQFEKSPLQPIVAEVGYGR